MWCCVVVCVCWMKWVKIAELDAVYEKSFSYIYKFGLKTNSVLT